MIVLMLMSKQANIRFGNVDRLPMQWSVDGDVTWDAPRRIALAFTPVLAFVALFAITVATFVLTPRTGDEGYVIPAVIFMALIFIAIHALHLWLINRFLESGGD